MISRSFVAEGIWACWVLPCCGISPHFACCNFIHGWAVPNVVVWPSCCFSISVNSLSYLPWSSILIWFFCSLFREGLIRYVTRSLNWYMKLIHLIAVLSHMKSYQNLICDVYQSWSGQLQSVFRKRLLNEIFRGLLLWKRLVLAENNYLTFCS